MSPGREELRGQLSALINEGRQMLERLPSLHAQALSGDASSLEGPVAIVIRSMVPNHITSAPQNLHENKVCTCTREIGHHKGPATGKVHACLPAPSR